MSADNNGSQHSIMSDVDFLTAKADLSAVHPSMVRSTGSLSAISTTKLNIIVSDYSADKPSHEVAKNSDDKEGESQHDGDALAVGTETSSNNYYWNAVFIIIIIIIFRVSLTACCPVSYSDWSGMCLL